LKIGLEKLHPILKLSTAAWRMLGLENVNIIANK